MDLKSSRIGAASAPKTAGAVALLILACASPRPRAARADERITRHDLGSGSVQWRIDEPNVKRRVTEYRGITFQPGDRLTIEAGGCAQTGGSGKTWKRYVDPRGPNADRLYHGLIWIPGVTGDLVRIQGVIARSWTILRVPDPSQLFLRLGYEDDDYGDNGYWGHDDGTGDQCKGVGNAYVVITVDRKPATTPPPTTIGDLDLVWDAVDDNLAPLNPRWHWQDTHPGLCPDISKVCPNETFIPPFTFQAPSLDTPKLPNSIFCFLEGEKIHGHVNWMPVTIEGFLRWDEHSTPKLRNPKDFDDDYNIKLFPRNPAGTGTGLNGLTSAVDKSGKEVCGTIGLEFDSDETIDHFHTPWWNSFHAAVDADDRTLLTTLNVDHDALKATPFLEWKYAIVSGLYGLDCEHSCHPELHPVYAMAILVQDDPNDEVWAIFVRNWGNEGFCSQYQHYIDLPNNRYAFRLPWRPGASSVTSLNRAGDRLFLANDARATGPDLTVAAGDSVLVSFTLPPPESKGRINGELHLRWPGGGTRPRPAPPVAARAAHAEGPAARPAAEEDHEPMAKVGTLVAGMTPKQRETFLKLLPAGAAGPADDQVPTMSPQVAAVPHLPRPSARGPVLKVRSAPDPIKSAKDEQRFRSVLAAFDGDVPGFPAARDAMRHLPPTPARLPTRPVAPAPPR